MLDAGLQRSRDHWDCNTESRDASYWLLDSCTKGHDRWLYYKATWQEVLITLLYILLGIICGACESELIGQRFASKVVSVVAAQMAVLFCGTILCHCCCNKGLAFVSDERAQSHLGHWVDECAWLAIAAVSHTSSCLHKRSQICLDTRACSTAYLPTCWFGTFAHTSKLCTAHAKGTASADGKTAAQHLWSVS